MKKIFSLVLVLALTLALGIPALAADAEETTPQITLAASAKKVEAGNLFTLTLSLTGELKDISSFEYYIHYDPTVVRLNSQAKTGTASEYTKLGIPPAENYTKTEKDNALTVSAVKLEGDGKFTMSEGTIATFEFAVQSDAETGASAGFALEKVAVCDSTFVNDAVKVQTGEAPEVTVGTAVVLGDVNGDGEIDNLDANLVYRYFNGKVTLTDEQLAAADVNGDGEVDNLDANTIYRYFNGKITAFPAA